MGENKHTSGDLKQMQALPLSAKLRMTERRIIDWIDTYGEDGVFISFSGGKDSTVLMDIVRNRMGLKNIPAVFVDVPTQFPELKEFVKTWDGVEILKPKLSFMQVREKYGFPLISKEISEAIFYAKKYVASVQDNDGDKHKGFWAIADLNGVDRRLEAKNSDEYKAIKAGKYKFGKPTRMLQLEGKMPHTENGKLTNEYSRRYDKSRWLFMIDAPFNTSKECCTVMKKAPLHDYQKRTGRNPMTGTMASESMLRESQWRRYGCNMYDAKNPISNPMAFWTDQDVLQYILENNVKICSVYGDIVEDYGKNVVGQLSLFGTSKQLKTTGCERTGCMLCGFGCHIEKNPNRFEQLKETHPGMYKMLDVVKNNGVTMREAIEWMNEHGKNVDIKL